jgi:hypothetical protein
MLIGKIMPLLASVLLSQNSPPVFTGPPPEKADFPSEFYHDFRGKPTPGELTWFNTKGDVLVQEQPDGLRITIPESFQHPQGGVGIKTAFGFKGDFDVTTTFELLEAQSRPSRYGIGVSLWIGKAGGGGAGISRLVREDNEFILCDIAIPPDSGTWLKVWPCKDKQGRLRLKRKGDLLFYLWSPETQGDDFLEMHKQEFGTADIEHIRLVALNGRTHAKVDARLLDLRVHGNLEANFLANRRSTLPIALLVFMGLTIALMTVLFTFLYVRRHRKDTAERLGAEGSKGP